MECVATLGMTQNSCIIELMCNMDKRVFSRYYA